LKTCATHFGRQKIKIDDDMVLEAWASDDARHDFERACNA
jgi:hypothetical protein